MWAEDTFQGKRVLVTGHTGFKGSWLSLWLARLGSEVCGYSLDPPTDPTNFSASSVASRIAKDVRGDVRDYSALESVVRDFAPQAVFHLAAQPIVRTGLAEPKSTFETNFNGTLNLLEAIRIHCEDCAVVVVTTDKCYLPSSSDSPYRVGDPLGGTEPYGASKAAAEIAVEAYRSAYFSKAGAGLPSVLASGGRAIRCATGRAGNVIGGGDWAADRIIPDAVAALSEGRPIPVRNPLSVRPWQHVLEPLHGYLRLAAGLLGGLSPGISPASLERPWNFGPSEQEELSVRELVELAIAEWGSGCWDQVADHTSQHEAAALRLGIRDTEAELNWYPVWGAARAVSATVHWYRAYLSGVKDAFELCNADIDAYEEDLYRRGSMSITHPIERKMIS